MGGTEPKIRQNKRPSAHVHKLFIFTTHPLSTKKAHRIRMMVRLGHQIRDAILIEKLSLRSPTVDLMPISTIMTMVNCLVFAAFDLNKIAIKCIERKLDHVENNLIINKWSLIIVIGPLFIEISSTRVDR